MGEVRSLTKVLFRVLGDVAAVTDETTTSVSASRLRALFALLILDANHVVSRAALIEAIWGDDQPRHADAALQVVMSRLRRAVGPEIAERIHSDGGGYRLDAGPEETDVTRVEMLLRDGRAHLAHRDPVPAARAFEQALEYWTGEPLDDLAAFPFHGSATRRLRELRLALLEARNDAYLNSGRHLQVLADIDEWVREEALREHLRAQQITALYRSGRQAEALAAISDLRRTLRDELGVSPSPALQDLERRVLDQDPELLAAEAGVSPSLPPWTAETLPFVGRDAECETVMDAMREARRSGFQFVLVEGAAGTGKSRFLLEIARRVGRDAVVVPVDVHEALQPSVVALARGIAAAGARLPADERELTLGDLDRFAVDATDRAPIEAVQAEVVPALAALSLQAPVLVLADDIDRAGPSLLHVIGQLGLFDGPKRVLVLGSARSPLTPTVERLYRGLRTIGQADRISLGALAQADIDELLRRMRVAPRHELTNALHELTSGDPFLLSEMLSSGQPERILETWRVPPRVRDVVVARVDELGRGGREVLEWAALLQSDFTVELLAEISGIARSTVETMVERAVVAHILHASGATTYRFVHDLARRTLANDVADAPRAEAHRRIAEQLEHTAARAAVLAEHWSQAAGADAAEKTVVYARLAGDDAMRAFEPHAASRWYRVALESVLPARERAELLILLGKAEQQGGRPGYVDTLREAIQIADDLHDDELLLQILASESPGWVLYNGFTRDEALPLLDRVAKMAVDDATRSRIDASRAEENQLTDPVGASQALDDALALARRSGDRVAVLEVLLRRMSILATPANLDEREGCIEEALPLAREVRDIAAEYALLGAAVLVAVERGDVARATEMTNRAEHLSAQYDLPQLRWSVMSRRAWWAAVRGDLHEAEHLIAAARVFGDENGIVHAVANSMLQTAALRWQQGREHEIVGTLRSMPEMLEAFPGVRLMLARALVSTPEHQDEARELMQGFRDNGLASIPLGSFWSTVMLLAAEVAAFLQLSDVAAAVTDQLAPYVDQVACMGGWVLGPIAHGAALAAAACGDERAPEWFHQSLVVADRLQSPLFRFRTESAWTVAASWGDERLRPPWGDDGYQAMLDRARLLGLEHLVECTPEAVVKA